MISAAAAAYLAKTADDEYARRRVEGSDLPPLTGDERPVIAISRTMDDWLEASSIELIDGPMVFRFDDGDDDDGIYDEEWRQ